ncbi:hypothetical protein Tco_0328425 [Tanacetum coccineum]
MDSKEGLGGGGFVVLGGRSSRESKNACGEVVGVEKISSTRSKFMARGEECLDVVERHFDLMEEPFSSRLEGIVVGVVELRGEDWQSNKLGRTS